MDDETKELIANRSAELARRYESALEAGLHVDANVVLEEFMALANELPATEPTLDDQLVAEADRCLANFDWDGTENVLLRRLAQPQNARHVVASTHMWLSSLYGLLDREEDALGQARQSVAAMRDYSITPMPLVMMLQAQARRCLQFRRVQEARIAVEESYTLLEESALWNILRAQAHILRAECALGEGSFDRAENDVEQAVELLEPMLAMEYAAGIRDCMSSCWAVRAELSFRKGAMSRAIACWQEAVTLARRVLEESQLIERELAYDLNGLANMLAGLSSAFISAGKLEEATGASSERAEIRSRLGLPA